MKKVIGVLIVCISLFIVSCGPQVNQGERPLDTAQALQLVQSGTEGIELTFLEGTPPSQLYDQAPFLAVLDVRNKGNIGVAENDCFVQITGIDPNIIRLPPVLTCGAIEGKNVYNVDGGFNQIQFGPTPISMPADVFEYNPPVQATVCYNYNTVTSPQVCIDPLFYQVSAEQKACAIEDVSMGGGQGAPIGINFVNVEMTGDKAIFEIDVSNLGGGRVLSRGVNIQECGSGVGIEDFDVIDYTVSLRGAGIGAGDCKPGNGQLRLSNGRGKIVCTFATGNSAAYETPITIDLAYSYMESITTDLKVVQTP